MNDELPKQYGNSGLGIALAIVAVAAIGFAMLFRAAMQPVQSALVGKPFPPFEAGGWVNGDQPKPEDLLGHVLVVDAWAFWCGPCLQTIDPLKELHAKYKDQGVIFIGLTSEGNDVLTSHETRQFIEKKKIPWLNGYAAIKPLKALEVDTIPQLWIVDRQNRIVMHDMGWGPNSVFEIDHAIENALKASDKPDQK